MSGLTQDLVRRHVAEGVETQESWSRLAQLGCDTAQGFFISRPLPRVVLVAWLRERGTEEPPRRLRLVG